MLIQSSAKLTNMITNRSRLMFDPLSELPRLEKWFEENPHPSWIQIDKITDTLNSMPYRGSYPRVSSHNVKIWYGFFKITILYYNTKLLFFAIFAKNSAKFVVLMKNVKLSQSIACVFVCWCLCVYFFVGVCVCLCVFVFGMEILFVLLC